MQQYIAKNFYGKFSPVVKYGIPDYDRDSEAWDKWIEEQLYYFHNGFDAGGDHITGRLYWKLNFTKILITNDEGYKRPASPYYVDTQKELYDMIDHCMISGEDIFEAKARDKGFSDDLAALTSFETMLQPFSETLALFPGGQSKALEGFNKKYNLILDNLLEDFKHHAGIKDSIAIKHYGRIDQETGAHLGIQSTLTTLKAVDSDVGKGGRYKLILVDEFGEIEDPLKLIETNRANLREGIKKFGIHICGGTSNAFSPTGYRDFRKLVRKSEEMGFKFLFIPAQKAYWGCVNLETGESDTEKAYADIKKIGAGKTGQDLMIYQQNYPTSIDEMLMVISGSPFNSAHIETQKSRIETDKAMQAQIQTGDLVYRNGKVKFELNPKGWWKIYRHPDKSLEYSDVIAIDSYRLSDVNKSEIVSKGAIMVRRCFQGINKEGSMTIAILRERPDDKDEFFAECIKAELYWNAQALIEYTDQDIMKYHEEHKMVKYVYKRPAVLEEIGRPSFSKANYKYGVKPSPEAKRRGLEIAVKEFNHTWENEPFIEVLEDLNNFTDENVDLGMCYMWSCVHALDRVSDAPREAARDASFIPHRVRLKSGQVMFVTSRKQYNALKGIPVQAGNLY